MRVKLLLFTFYLNSGLHAVSIGKPSQRMWNFWMVRFLKAESEPNFSFPHIANFYLMVFCITAFLQLRLKQNQPETSDARNSKCRPPHCRVLPHYKLSGIIPHPLLATCSCDIAQLGKVDGLHYRLTIKTVLQTLAIIVARHFVSLTICNQLVLLYLNRQRQTTTPPVLEIHLHCE